MKSSSYLAMLLLSPVLGLSSLHAQTTFKETWAEQAAGDSDKKLNNWKSGGQGTSTCTVVEEGGRKVLSIEQTGETFGITSNGLFPSKRFSMAFDMAFQEGEKKGPQASVMLFLSSGGRSYVINIRPDNIQISKFDPTHPNPDPNYSLRAFTPLIRTKAGGATYTSSDMKHFELKLNQKEGATEISLYDNNEAAPAATVTDTTPVELGDAVSVVINLENEAVAKFGDIVVKAE